MKFLQAAALTGIWLSSTLVHAAPRDILAAFSSPSNNWDAGTTITLPDNATVFQTATVRWNSNDAPGFAIAITPATEEDAAKAVTIAKNFNFPFLATGGRHSSSITLATIRDGLAIDLSALNSVRINTTAPSVTVGGGTRFRQVVDPLYNAGFYLPIGSCPCPGMVGATIGGGIGRYQGLDGLIIDNLLSVRIVTADGRLITASKDSNADLFWAVRGAGANFGVIVSATYRIHPLSRINNGQILSGDFVIPAASNGSYYDILASLQGTIPVELGTISIAIWNETLSEATILVNWVWLGNEQQGRRFFSRLNALNPIQTNIYTVPWNRLTAAAAFGLGTAICEPVRYNGYGLNFRNLSSSTYQEVFGIMDEFWRRYPDGRTSSVEIEIFAPHAVRRVANDATAYPWRDTLGYTLYSFAWATAETERVGERYGIRVRDAFARTAGFNGPAVYVSYAHGDETLEQMYGSNTRRLLQLKQKWDPQNRFRFFNNIARR